jgi:hypothetical protein
MFITSYDDWIAEYRKDKYKIWIRATLSNNLDYYLPEYSYWLKLKDFCDEANLFVKKVGLQYRSNSIEVDVSDADGAYLVQSILGTIGEKSKQTITIGKVYGDIIKKTMWIVPELVEELSTEDSIENSFKEALIFKHGKEETSPI